MTFRDRETTIKSDLNSSAVLADRKITGISRENQKKNMGFAMVKSAVIDGIEVREVCVEADIGNGLPVFHMVGYLSSEVKEAGERVRTAIRHTKVRLQPQRMVVNLSPADIRKKGASFDLPIAAALGAGIDISKPFGNIVVDIGGGTTDVAVISYGDTVVSQSLKVAGNDFDDAIIRYLRKKYEILVGERTAEEIKKQIGTAYPRDEEETMEVCGRNVLTGLPKTIVMSSVETQEALESCLTQIITGLHKVLEETPPELSADIATRGILLTGGGSLLYGMDRLIEQITGIRTTLADDPISVVAIGTGRYTEFMEAKKGER